MTRRIVPALPSRFRSSFGQLFGVVFAAISGFFVARFPVRPELAFVSAIFVLVFAYTSYAGIIRWLGARRGIMLLVVLGVYAMIIETLAVKTGYPYGSFAYGAKIGALLFDAVPWTVFFTWTPLVLLAMVVTARYVKNILFAGVFLVLIDMVLDPGAVAQGFWRYAAGGLYYHVPFSNFAGWLLTGSTGVAIARFLTREFDWAAAPKSLTTSGLLSVVFWTSVCGWMHLWVPLVLGGVLVGLTLLPRLSLPRQGLVEV
jgi:bisanhydrobacterioruberin hydratase